MNSFNIEHLWQDYREILSGFNKTKSFFRFLFFPVLVSLIIVIFIEFNEPIIGIFGIMISILIGLLFNFVSTFSAKIESRDLNQPAKEKIKRLKLIKETYTSAFISIVACIFALILIFLTVITYSESVAPTIIGDIKFGFNKVFSFLLIFVVYHLMLLLVLMINRLKKLLDIDVDKELEVLEKERQSDINGWN